MSDSAPLYPRRWKTRLRDQPQASQKVDNKDSKVAGIISKVFSDDTEDKNQCEDLHQMYFYYGDNRKLLYIGISKSAVQRMAQHKGRPWDREVKWVRVIRAPTRRDLEDAERYAIQTLAPKYNVAHNANRGKFRERVIEEMGHTTVSAEDVGGDGNSFTRKFTITGPLVIGEDPLSVPSVPQSVVFSMLGRHECDTLMEKLIPDFCIDEQERIWTEMIADNERFE